MLLLPETLKAVLVPTTPIDAEEAVNKAVKLGPSLGLIIHVLPKMSENSFSTMILPHCIQIANEVRKLT